MTPLNGRLRLVCAREPGERSILRESGASGTFHVSKPYWDGNVLQVQVSNPTAGILEGDRLESYVRVEESARLFLTPTSAMRLYSMEEAGAESHAVFLVEKNAWLEVFPELLIPQASARFRQHNEIRVAAGAELYFAETLAPGRLARGEAYAFEALDLRTDLLFEGRIIASDRCRLRPEALPPSPWPFWYYAAVWVVSEKFQQRADVWERIEALGSDSLQIGCSELLEAAWGVKLLARDSLILREALRQVRSIAAEAIPYLRMQPRKW
ncbi:MAG: urease accessory protein UreD [Methylacidiphilaceae bacterium]|nr:urease accessory protein UreD [Candidatus Methylacidiphilaceae bacterium]